MDQVEPKFDVLVVSDVSDRDGIGIEVYTDDQLTIEIFRDDANKTREITLWRQDVPLDLVEQAIVIFKKKIPWEFLDKA